MTTISIIIPSHGRPELLRTTLASALAQTGIDLEVVVVDDGSPTPVAEVLADLGDERVRVVRNETPRGVGGARNRGIEEATGTWLAFLDDDDLWAPDKLSSQVAAAEAADAPWAYSGAVQFLPGPVAWHNSQAKAPDLVAIQLPYENAVPAGASNVIARADVVDRVGGFDADIPHLADWDMWLRLLRVGAPAGVLRCQVAYRLHPTNMALRGIEGMDHEMDVIDERHPDLRGGEPLDRTPVHYWIALAFWRAGRRAEARAAYLRAFRAGHRPAWRRIVRTFVPVQSLRDLLPGSEPVAWPDGADQWLVPQLAHEGAA